MHATNCKSCLRTKPPVDVAKKYAVKSAKKPPCVDCAMAKLKGKKPKCSKK